MNGNPQPNELASRSAGKRIRAYGVHVYTASGVALAFLAACEIGSTAPSAPVVFVLLAIAVLIDATDGPLARQWEVKRWASQIDGRTIDDIVDYLTFTFVPLLLIWRMGWLPEPGILWIVPALVASLFGFANSAAKNEVSGYFLGFPSYWNIVAFYAGLWHRLYGPWPNGVLLLGFALLTVLPIRFVYPNLTPHPWRLPVIAGALLWLAIVLFMLIEYSQTPEWLVWLSLIYPMFYVALSLFLQFRRGEPKRVS